MLRPAGGSASLSCWRQLKLYFGGPKGHGGILVESAFVRVWVGRRIIQSKEVVNPAGFIAMYLWQ